MSIFEYIFKWCSKRRPSIVSDGDWDGIVGSAILYKKLTKYKIKIHEISFPPPHIIPRLELSDCIIVELPSSKGYRVTGENLLIDHHGFVGVKRIFPSGDEIFYKANRFFRSVAELIAFITGFEADGEWRKILDAVNLIDEGRGRENNFTWMLHSAYLYNIEDTGFRKLLFKFLIEEKFTKLLEVCRKGATDYEKARKHISKIKDRAIEMKDRAIFTWYMNNRRDEKVIFREAMLELEKDYNLVVIAAIKDNRILRLHLGSMKGRMNSSLLAEKIAVELRKRGFKVTAGGRKNVAGVQILSVNKPSVDEMLQIIKEILQVNQELK